MSLVAGVVGGEQRGPAAQLIFRRTLLLGVDRPLRRRGLVAVPAEQVDERVLRETQAVVHAEPVGELPFARLKSISSPIRASSACRPSARSLPGAATRPACLASIESPGGRVMPGAYGDELREGLRVEADDVPVAPEELRHDELARSRRELGPRLGALPDVPILELDVGIGEKLPHAAALLSGRSARVRVQRVENDLVVDERNSTPVGSVSRIRRVDVYAVRYTHAGGAFALSGGRVAGEQDATVVRIETDGGSVGWGEQCVFTPSFLPGFGPSTRAVLEPLARAILGADPCQVEAVYARMEAAIRGSAYAKSALDIACWDLFGKETGRRVGDLLGGVRQEELSLYTGVGISPLDETRKRCAEALAAGFRQVQVKVGTASWREDVARIEASVEALGDVDRIIVDANGFWSQADAVRVVAAVDQLDIYVEQPCASVAECAQVRLFVPPPFDPRRGLDRSTRRSSRPTATLRSTRSG